MVLKKLSLSPGLYIYCGLSIYFFLLADSGLLHISVQPRFGDKDKINTCGTRIESTKTVCHHTGTGLHGYGKLGCSWKVCLPQTLLCAVITALRVCCPAVSAGTAAEKVHVSEHPAAETELWLPKKWRRCWRCCTDASHVETAETVTQLLRLNSDRISVHMFFPLFFKCHTRSSSSSYRLLGDFFLWCEWEWWLASLAPAGSRRHRLLRHWCCRLVQQVAY